MYDVELKRGRRDGKVGWCSVRDGTSWKDRRVVYKMREDKV